MPEEDVTMISMPDRAAIKQAHTLKLEPRLRTLLTQRIGALNSPDYDLRDLTHLVIVEPGDSEQAIIAEVGFSPLDGTCDWISDHGGWFEAIMTVGNSGFAFVLFIGDDGGPVAKFCRAHLS